MARLVQLCLLGSFIVHEIYLHYIIANYLLMLIFVSENSLFLSQLKIPKPIWVFFSLRQVWVHAVAQPSPQYSSASNFATTHTQNTKREHESKRLFRSARLNTVDSERSPTEFLLQVDGYLLRHATDLIKNCSTLKIIRGLFLMGQLICIQLVVLLISRFTTSCS